MTARERLQRFACPPDREVAAILEAAGGGPPDLAAITAVMGRHGLTTAP